MERYDYREAVMDDVREYIKNEIDLEDWKGNRDGLEAMLNNDLINCDSVTGNASGSYTFNSWLAEEYLAHNWELIEECASEFGTKPVISTWWEHGAEWWDVSIRCYLLGGAINEVLDELDEELEGE